MNMLNIFTNEVDICGKILVFPKYFIIYLFRNVNPGNLTKQIELRNKLECKPFKWYEYNIFFADLVFIYHRFMENVAFDLPQYYPPIPLPPYATGEVKKRFFEMVDVNF
jgi:hypothetical protein